LVLASLSGTGYGIVIGAYLLICLIAFLVSPRDLNGRGRAMGCLVGLVLFFGLFVVAFAAWAADNIF
jgi:tetrahydromethanopterin S-methyltransferase subunit G